ncbi:hypothetical protein P389DRAFT_189847 [Cystobasidium minutum MCA 4210]|uniref:uncharacterized protein n=1 Tax=Cystobasidium minutum MCA 4210 TaxID=1397322 RepID=UPI0034CD3B3B|eukprot:jgi/Rhomi1/189847/estExt_fgenesh1_pg.C_4_t10471
MSGGKLSFKSAEKSSLRKQPEAMWSQSMAVERFRLCNLETILEQARLAKSIGNARRTVTGYALLAGFTLKEDYSCILGISFGHAVALFFRMLQAVSGHHNRHLHGGKLHAVSRLVLEWISTGTEELIYEYISRDTSPSSASAYTADSLGYSPLPHQHQHHSQSTTLNTALVAHSHIRVGVAVVIGGPPLRVSHVKTYGTYGVEENYKHGFSCFLAASCFTTTTASWKCHAIARTIAQSCSYNNKLHIIKQSHYTIKRAFETCFSFDAVKSINARWFSVNYEIETHLTSGALSSPRSPGLKVQQQHQVHEDALSLSSSTTNTPQMDSSAVFERDVEFANEHLLTGSEAIDLAAAPVLSEVALAVTSDDVSALSSAQAPSSGVLSGGATPGTASPMLTQSLVSTILSSSPKLPANAVLFNNDAQEPYGASGVVPLSEQLRRSSGAGSAGHASSGVGGIAGSGRPTSEEFSSPPPSLSLSPSASTTSPISSTPGSPVQALHPGSASGSGIGQHAPAGAQFGYGLTSMEQLETGVPMEGVHAAGADGGALAMQSPPGSSSMSGVSLSGNKDSKRRLSMISYADIINSERLSDTHSGFSSPTPSSALSLSAAALPIQGGSGSQSPVRAQSGSGANLSPSPTPGAIAGAGTGSALYSPLTSPEESTAFATSPGLPGKESVSSRQTSQERDSIQERTTLSKPGNYRTDTMSTTATEVIHIPGQMPLQTPPAGEHSENKEDTDVTPTNSKIKNASSTAGDAAQSEGDSLKNSTSSSTSSWNMVELGKALVGNAAGAVGSILGTSGIGTGDDEDGKESAKAPQGAR